MKSDGKVLVTGASGFIGKNLVRYLLTRGQSVKAMVRKTSMVSFPPSEKLELVYADMLNMPSLQTALQNVGVVVHLAALTADEKESEKVNVGGAKRLVEACKAEKCDRIINISSQSAKIKRKGIYARTKSEADRVFHSSGLQVTTLLPSIVYGKELSGVFGSIVTFAQKLPLVPVLGDGKWISAPICIEDVSNAIVSCIERYDTTGKMYDLGGPDLISFDNLIDKICAELDIRRLKIHIPFVFSLAIANIVARILPRPPITVSNVLGSNQNTNIDISPARRDFGFNPTDLDTGLKSAIHGKNLPNIV